MPTLFDLATAPLDPGATLLEASAGTGKTWMIAGLYARLVGECGLRPREILAVTFTEAATAELRERLRHRLIEVRGALLNGDASADGAVLALRAAIDAGKLTAAEADRRFAVALGGFDEAAIHTIHGFCQRLLREQAFTCGTPFDIELEPDGESLRQRAADDVWRRLMDPAQSTPARLAVAAGWSPEKLARLHRAIAQAGHAVVVNTGSGGLDQATAEAQLREAAVRAANAWKEVGQEVQDLLDGHPGVSRKKDGGLPPEARDRHAAALAVATADPLDPEVLAACEAFAAEKFDGAYRLKKAPPPEHPFFAIASEVAAALVVWRGATLDACLTAIDERLETLGAERGILTFDDLIRRVHAALAGPQGGDLAQRIRERLRAALIDEFQDTDSRQWAIFRHLFRHAGGRLYLIGDPKQAIYRFRGADLFAYLGARAELAAAPDARIHTLGHNYRSRADLVEAVNALFAGAPEGFLGGGVDFAPVAAAAPAREQLRLGASALRPCLQFRIELPAGQGVEAQRERLARAAAAYAGHLLAEGWIVPAEGGGAAARPVVPADLAILVRTNQQAVLLEQALRDRGIVSIRQTDESVYATPEADELQAILTGLREAGNDGAWRAALATRILGANATRLDALLADDTAWAAELERAARWRQLWEERSFIRAFRALLDESGVRERWLSRPGGERALTNLLHLGELLHETARSQRLGPDALLRHLQRSRQEAGNSGVTPEQHLLRLETDTGAIPLVTVHRAKGLEYGIVLAPFHALAAPGGRSSHCAWHDPDGRPRLDLTGTPPPEGETAAEQEALEDEGRLLYVSLTRPRVHLAIFDTDRIPPRGGPGPLVRLLGGREVEVVAVADPDALEVPGWTPGSGPARPAAAVAAEPVPARAARELAPDPLFESFSALTAAAEAASAREPHHVEEADRDPEAAQPVEVPTEVRAPTIHSLPAGARTGDALHGVLEGALSPDAAVAAVPLRERLMRAFQRHLLPADHLEVTLEAMQQALDHPYQAANGGILRLSDLPAAARRPEIAFLVPLRAVPAARVADVLAGAPGLPADLPHRLGAVRRALADGYLTGFLDLVVRDAGGRHHLFDWKSNRLGPDHEAYTLERMEEAMAASLYGLQFHLYLVAMMRHLRHAVADFDPARHLGEVRYVFLRGLDPEDPARGVYTVQPDPERLLALEALLCPASGREGGA